MILLAAPAALGQEFLVAASVGDPISPSAFTLKLGPFDCRVLAAGSARCSTGRETWKSRLPTDDGSIERVFVSRSPEIVLVYEVSDGESSWAYIAHLEPHQRRTLWYHQFPGLNTATPVSVADSVVVAAPGYIASFQTSSGLANWQHDWQYESEAGTDVRIEVSGGVACYRSRLYDRDRLVQCFDVKSGLQSVAGSAPN